MKHYILTVLLVLTLHILQAMPDKQISIKSFGAKGDGKTNDHEAFKKAADYINEAKQHITLIIPYGTYIVGKQIPGKEWLLEGQDVLQLKGCHNITIKGEMKKGKYPRLRYSNGLYFGSFYTEGEKRLTPKCAPQQGNYNKATCAFIGACFRFFECRNMRVSSIEIDGNQHGMILGGYYGDKGRQLNHRGFYLIKSQQVTLQNINVHHTGLDGIEIVDSDSTTLQQFVSAYNGRQGLSWVGGRGLTAINCKFNNTGNDRISTAPGAGMDIEPEGATEISDGLFENCEFMNNSGCAVVNERNKLVTKNMEFNHCTFVGRHNFALWIWGLQFRFNYCSIYGYCTNAVNAADVKTPDDITSFKHCIFSNAYKNKLTQKVAGYLLEFNYQSVYIEDSKITSYDVGFMWHGGVMNPEIARSHVFNTTIRTNNTKAYHCSTSGITFKGCDIAYTEKVGVSLDGASPATNTIRAQSLKQLNQEMKSATILPYVNTINPYICTEK